MGNHRERIQEMNTTKKDQKKKTREQGKARQEKRRQQEKQWLQDHGITSWEALHTELVKGEKVIKTP